MLFQKHALVIVTITLFSLFSGCSKKDKTPLPPPSTDLKLTFSDVAGNKVSFASVSLYTTESDWNSESNATRTSTSDANGQVTFSGLSPAKYWWRGRSGCMTNANSTFSTPTAIGVNQTTQINSILQSTGTLKFSNTSSNPYKVYINGTYVGDQNGGTNIIVTNVLTGDYTFRVVQISGYAFSPTDKSYTGTIICGGTLAVIYP